MSYIRSFAAIVSASALLQFAAVDRPHAMGQRVGDFELAMDAPWRMEPRRDPPSVCNDEITDCDAATGFSYGPIPIQITITDAHLPTDRVQSSDPPRTRFMQRALQAYSRNDVSILDILFVIASGALPESDAISAFDRFPNVFLRHFVSLTVSEEVNGAFVPQQTFGVNDLHEVERTRGVWQWAPETSPPPGRPINEICRRWNGEDCRAIVDLTGSSEWHAIAMYRPRHSAPGSDLKLKLDLTLFAKSDRLVQKPCATCGQIDTDGDGTLDTFIPRLVKERGLMESKTFTQYVNVHLGEAPLPSFGPSWHYGDLHYHSQGTDNDGETAYSYRGTLQAMAALGLDFIFATDHASNSRQIISLDTKASRELVEPIFGELRDLSPDRFRFYLEHLHGPGGANREVASFPRSEYEPSTSLSTSISFEERLVVPQVFLGAEVDVIPEYADDSPGVPYPFMDACREIPSELAVAHTLNPLAVDVCDEDDMTTPTFDGRLMIRDIQGPASGNLISKEFFGRQHVLHLPEDPTRGDAFIPSDTSKYGGATHRLRELLDVQLDGRANGVAFLAHPRARPSGSGVGRLGPDLSPFSYVQLEDAFRSERVLGLQIWNENGFRSTEMDEGDAVNFRPDEEALNFNSDDVLGGYRGEFIPVADLATWAHRDGHGSSSVYFGEGLWDTMLIWGLNPKRTSPLPWLEVGEPRRLYMAGGSDAHGDFNFRREGYFVGVDKVSSTAIGAPRNLVQAGEPEGQPISSGAIEGRPVSQAQVVEALREGRFVVTDGPIVRVAFDRDGDGRIGGSDGSLGDIVTTEHDCDFSLVVEWQSTQEFGPVRQIDLTLGVFSDSLADGWVYRAWRRPEGAQPGDLGYSASDFGGTKTWQDPNGNDFTNFPSLPGGIGREATPLFLDPTDDLRLALQVPQSEAYEGVRQIKIDPAEFSIAELREELQCDTSPALARPESEHGRDLRALASSMVAARGASVSGQPVSLHAAIGTDSGSGGGGGTIDPGAGCTVTRKFENAVKPNRLYVRAKIVNDVEPGTDRDCSPFVLPPEGDLRPYCIRRQGYSNPMWIELKRDLATAACAPTDNPVIR